MSENTNSPTTGTTYMHDDDTIARIALACAGVSGDPSVAVAIELMGGAVPFIAAVHDGRDHAVALTPATRQRIRTIATVSRVTGALNAMIRHGVGVLTPLHAAWPTQVAALRGAAPLVLWVRGNVAVLKLPSIAWTGTSTPTAFGIHLALELGTGLADRGWVIAAGVGNGIDRLVLKAARAMGGQTVTVAASGPLGDHPAKGSGGVVISELPPTAFASIRGQQRAKFLLAAIATKTILIEADAGSGAVRTAAAAHALGRPVGVGIGADGSAASTGCRDLAARHGLAVIGSIADADRLR